MARRSTDNLIPEECSKRASQLLADQDCQDIRYASSKPAIVIPSAKARAVPTRPNASRSTRPFTVVNSSVNRAREDVRLNRYQVNVRSTYPCGDDSRKAIAKPRASAPRPQEKGSAILSKSESTSN